MQRCVIYLRVSDERQVDGFSLAAQERGARLVAAKEDLEVWRVYTDGGQSGKDDQRDAFQEMLSDLKQHRNRERLTTVIIHKLDRFMRDLRLTLNFEHDLKRMKVRLMSVVNPINTDTPEGRLQFQMEGSLAEWFRGNLSREVKKGLNEKARQGLWVGPVPFGYAKQGDTLTPSDDAETVRAIFQMYASGKHSDISIAETLNETTAMLNWRTGERYRFGRESIRGILRNRVYTGKVSCGDVEYDGQHEALITESQWEMVKDLRNRHTHKGGKPQQHEPGILLGIGYCGECGAKMWQHTSGRPDRDKRLIRYYRCSGITRCGCDAGLHAIDQIDQQVLDLLLSLMPSDELLERSIALIQQDVPVVKPQVDRTAMVQQLNRLTDVYIEGRITREVYEQRYQHLEQQLAATQSIVVAPPSVDLQKAIAVLRDLPLLITHATPSERHQVAGILFDRVWIAKKQIAAITPHQVFAHLIDAMTAFCVGGVADGARTPAPTHSDVCLHATMARIEGTAPVRFWPATRIINRVSLFKARHYGELF